LILIFIVEVVTCLQIRVETLKIVWIVTCEKIEKYTDHNDTYNGNTILKLHNSDAMFYLQF